MGRRPAYVVSGTSRDPATMSCHAIDSLHFPTGRLDSECNCVQLLRRRRRWCGIWCGIEICETHNRTSFAVSRKLGRLDSNQDYRGQNPTCCQLHHGPITTTVPGASKARPPSSRT